MYKSVVIMYIEFIFKYWVPGIRTSAFPQFHLINKHKTRLKIKKSVWFNSE